jgi:hypothetical protein
MDVRTSGEMLAVVSMVRSLLLDADDRLAHLFKQYYTFVNKDPAKLHCFYTKKSTLIHGVEGEDSQPCYGQQVREGAYKAAKIPVNLDLS